MDGNEGGELVALQVKQRLAKWQQLDDQPASAVNSFKNAASSSSSHAAVRMQQSIIDLRGLDLCRLKPAETDEILGTALSKWPLTHLHLDKNGLDRLPGCMACLAPSLLVLTLSGNQFTISASSNSRAVDDDDGDASSSHSISETDSSWDIGELHRRESSNGESSSDAACSASALGPLKGFTALTQLDLSSNLLKDEFPGEAGGFLVGMTSLKTLKLDQNAITTLSSSEYWYEPFTSLALLCQPPPLHLNSFEEAKVWMRSSSLGPGGGPGWCWCGVWGCFGGCLRGVVCCGGGGPLNNGFEVLRAIGGDGGPFAVDDFEGHPHKVHPCVRPLAGQHLRTRWLIS